MHVFDLGRFLCILFFTATPPYSFSYALGRKTDPASIKKVSFHFKGLKSKIFPHKATYS